MELCVVTDIKNGIGNILSEIFVGLFFTKKLSEITGEQYNYYGFLTERCFNNHEILYTKYHYDSMLPHPLNLSAVFPKINFLSRLPGDMENFHYLSDVDINRFKNIKRLNISVDYAAQVILELKDNTDILNNISFNETITKYTLSKYAPSIKSLAVHVRLVQKGDYMYIRLPDLQWYKNAIEKYITENGAPDKIFLITGVCTSRDTNSNIKNEILVYLKSISDNVVDVLDEPYYIDISIISQCGGKIITNSTFSLFASFIDFDYNKTVYYPDLLDKQFRLNNNIIFPNFIKLP